MQLLLQGAPRDLVPDIQTLQKMSEDPGFRDELSRLKGSIQADRSRAVADARKHWASLNAGGMPESSHHDRSPSCERGDQPT